MAGAVDPSRCPLCGQENQCGVASGQGTCWCFDATIPASVLERIPEEARNVACVCAACARGDAPGTARLRGRDGRVILR